MLVALPPLFVERSSIFLLVSLYSNTRSRPFLFPGLSRVTLEQAICRSSAGMAAVVSRTFSLFFLITSFGDAKHIFFSLATVDFPIFFKELLQRI